MVVLTDKFCHKLTGTTSKDDQVYQRVCSQAVRAVYGNAGDLTGGIETGQRRPLWINHDTRISIGRDTTHGVVRSRLNGYRFGDRFHTEVVTSKVGDIRQLLGDRLGSQVTHIQVEVVFAIDTAPLFDLLHHTARDDI